MKKIVSIFSVLVFLLSCESQEELQRTHTVEVSSVGDKLRGNITKGQHVVLKAQTYELTGALTIKEGGSLTIPAGARIEATEGVASFIAVARNAKIYIEGTAENPVVMTSGNNNPKAGDWGGLIVAGNAPNNRGDLVMSEMGDLAYGGNNPSDNSGKISHLRLEYTGAQLTSKKQFNGLTLYSVGSGTEIDHVQSYHSADDGVEIFGGTVNLNHLVVVHAEDDGVDFTDGWQGQGNYWYIDGVEKTAIEGSNNENDAYATPLTKVVLKNLTIKQGELSGNEAAIYLKEGAGEWQVESLLIEGFRTIFHMNEDELAIHDRLTKGLIQIRYQQTKSSNALARYSNFQETPNQGAGKGLDFPDWALSWGRK